MSVVDVELHLGAFNLALIGVIGITIAISSWYKNQITEYFKPKPVKNLIEDDDTLATLHFERSFTRNGDWDRADAILMRLLKIPETQTILVVGDLEIVRNNKPFELDDKVMFQLLELKVDRFSNLEHITFKIFSSEMTVCELREHINHLVEEYIIIKKNTLGDIMFYFDHIVQQPNIRTPHPHKILFSKHRFSTNRTLENIFHERQDEVRHRVNFFLTRKDWYDKRGIPHTLGLLLHGTPGTGKTSTIKAIANEAHRHIININLGAVRTKKQLKKLFYDDRIEVCENMENTNSVTEYIIPINKRIYVIEDIDVIDSDLVLKRAAKTNTSILLDGTPVQKGLPVTDERNPDNTSDLDLSTILNIIDGTLETPGRILIITSNYPEKLDEALIRPGRIDMLIEYKRCNRQILTDMYRSFFDINPDPMLVSKIPEYIWTPAEVGQLLFKNFGDPEKALQELIELDPTEYFKFSHHSQQVTILSD